MICPVEIARDLFALRAARVGDHAKHDLLPEGTRSPFSTPTPVRDSLVVGYFEF
jgi:hypothetical protein